jgi:glycosyltransferase involved in cell wall biosynthesis
VIDDGSTDMTPALLRQEKSPTLTVISNPELRPGWLGKVSALQSGYEAADSEYIICLDADVRLESHAIATAVNQLHNLHLDYICPYPRQATGTFSEKLIQPLLHWSWMSTVALRLAEKYPRRSTAVANGQFFIIRKNALDAIGGFEKVQDQILDDIELARALIAAGFKGVVTEGSSLAVTRMYKSFAEIKAGYGKSLHRAFGGILGTSIAMIFIFLSSVLPFLLALNGYLIGWIAYFMVVFTRQLSATRSRGSLVMSFLHPLSAALLIYLIIYSWRMRGSIQWKGRTV